MAGIAAVGSLRLWRPDWQGHTPTPLSPAALPEGVIRGSSGPPYHVIHRKGQRL